MSEERHRKRKLVLQKTRQAARAEKFFPEEMFFRFISRPFTKKGGFYRAQTPIVGVSRYCPCLRRRLHCHESTERGQTTGTELLWTAI
jgi:hypothetical protein